ncbi:hypothetical protein Z517_09236 [Fonsecaea pedrosoi CBS 271.37]|uniref:Uncharacterized protein n=1 Tax=Fonsecaea pedrosoi CBS 271.37 TaxID=1442368 RepID=A0A0D2ERA5_9EURO|nr:uncharacterized protein Z517_09236 [Fonsecaea pedrosoi CBS 271.37]KIW76792.1 hypothetical protein Z517_09236 [Fonsecaea pedrosoi CBS 271.37]
MAGHTPTNGTAFSPQFEPEQDPADNTVAVIGLDATGLALAAHFMDRGCQVLVYQAPDNGALSSNRESCSLYRTIQSRGFWASGAIWQFEMTPRMVAHPQNVCHKARTIFITKPGQTKEIIDSFGGRCDSKHCFLFVEGGPDWKDLGNELKNSASVFNIPFSPYACDATSGNVHIYKIRDRIRLEELKQSNEGNAQSLLGVALWPWRHSLGWSTQMKDEGNEG